MIFQNFSQNWWFLGAKMMIFQILVKIDGFSKLPMPHFHIYHIWYGLTKVLRYCETETSIEYHKSVARLFVTLEGLVVKPPRSDHDNSSGEDNTGAKPSLMRLLRKKRKQNKEEISRLSEDGGCDNYEADDG